MASEAEEATEDDTRRAIMRATYRALCKHGYANLTMQDIADEFDKSKSLLHYHYDTKEDLLLAFLDNLIGWIGDRLAETETTDPRERLHEFIEKFVIDPDESHRESFALALFELRLQAVHNEAFRDRLAKHYAGNVSTVSTIIQDGIDEGVFVPVDSDRIGETIYATLVGARLYQVTLGASQATRTVQTTLEEYIDSQLIRD